jgi:hypothetical protein
VENPQALRSASPVMAKWKPSPLIQDVENPSAPVRLLILADGPGATQVISFDLPFRALREAGKMQLLMVQEADFQGLSPVAAENAVRQLVDDFRPTHVVVSRFAGNGAASIPKALAAHGLGYVVHLDDNLFAVPAELGRAKFERYNNPCRLNRLRLLCERARLIYTSTAPLKLQLDAMQLTPPVEAGQIYCAVPITPAPYKPANGAPVFGYMGTSGHAADLEMIAPTIAAVLKTLPNAHFETFGSIKPPKSLTSAFGNRVREIKAANSYLGFLEAFQRMNWQCGLAPLVQTPFNECKADTKFVEYSLAGMPVVASDLVVYSRIAAEGRGRLAKTTGDWTSAIVELLTDEPSGKAMTVRAQEHITHNYSMSGLRVQALRMLGISL